MEANELMTGDWVILSGDPNPQQVQELLIDSVTIQCWPHRFDDINPIPLTPEILEKNGFKNRNGYQWIYKDNYSKIRIDIAPKVVIDGEELGEPPICLTLEGVLFNINMSIKYVHELQHALKICEIEKEIVL